MFCADIRGHSWQSAHTHARGNIHHGTAALLFHVGDNALRQLDYRLHIYLVAHFPSVRVGLHDRSVEHGRRIIYKNIDPTEIPDCRVYQVLPILFFAQIRRHGDGRPT